MEPLVPPGSSGGVCQGMMPGGGAPQYYFGLYEGAQACAEYGTVAEEMPSFMSSLYPLDQAAGTEAAAAAEMEEEEEQQLDRALAASRNHREAEKRRRERIKNHLDRLRTILACDAKIEKASLLAKAVEHVRDLKQRAAEIGEVVDDLPSETDEVSVCGGAVATASGRRRPVIRASLCCEDRSGLLPELAETLKSLRLRVLRAEIATLGGRVRSVLVVAGDECVVGEEENAGGGGGGGGGDDGQVAAFLRDALTSLIDRPPGAAAGGLAARPKRRRVLSRSSSAATA